MLHNERLRRFETSLFTVIRKRRFDATGRRILGTRHHTGVTTLGKLIEHEADEVTHHLIELGRHRARMLLRIAHVVHPFHTIEGHSSTAATHARARCTATRRISKLAGAAGNIARGIALPLEFAGALCKHLHLV